MNKWEINRVSTPERIFDKIKTEMARPVGIVIFGADCKLKDEVVNKTVSNLPGLATSTNAAPTPTLVRHIQNHDIVAVILTPEESAIHGLRHELVKVMRNAGAKTVVGIYAKAKKYSPKALTRLPYASAVNQQSQAIEQSNPTADGLDYFIVVEDG